MAQSRKALRNVACASQKKSTIGQISVKTYLKFKVLLKGFSGSEKSQKLTSLKSIHSW